MIINKIIYEFLWNVLKDIIVVKNVSNNKIEMHFKSDYLIFGVLDICKCVQFGKIFTNEVWFFSFGQSMKKIIMVTFRTKNDLGQCCNVFVSLNLSHFLCQQVQICKLYRYMKELHIIHEWKIFKMWITLIWTNEKGLCPQIKWDPIHLTTHPATYLLSSLDLFTYVGLG